MTTLAHTAQIAGPNVNRVTIGSVCKVAAAIAVVGMISAFSTGQVSRAHFAPVATGHTEQSDLRTLLCRIDRRCPAVELAQQTATTGEASTNALDEADHSDLSSLLCRIDRRCPAVDVADQMAITREATAMMTADNRVR